jgi:hypothetical protein
MVYASRRRTRISARRRALELLARSPDGCTEALMLANGFTVEQMMVLVQSGLASAEPERMVVGPRTIERARVRITEAGRRVLNPNDARPSPSPRRRIGRSHRNGTTPPNMAIPVRRGGGAGEGLTGGGR